jgi:hypothetical protein
VEGKELFEFGDLCCHFGTAKLEGLAEAWMRRAQKFFHVFKDIERIEHSISVYTLVRISPIKKNRP